MPWETVILRFSFELLDETPPDNQGLEDIRWRGPNKFVIGCPPMLLNFRVLANHCSSAR